MVPLLQNFSVAQTVVDLTVKMNSRTQRSIVSILLFVLLQAANFVDAYRDPLPCTGMCHDTHDPSIIQRASDGLYFRFATGGGIDFYTAPSITGPWSSAGVVLPNGSSINNSGSDDAWAPDVHLVDGIYYCYYAVSTFGTQISAIGVATSPTMDAGTWVDHGSTGLSSKDGDDYNTIDPNLFQWQGTNYMTFGSFWGDIFQTTMSSNALTVSAETPYGIEFNGTGTHPSEGAYVFKHKKHFYLFFSSGICCGYDTEKPAPGEEYKIMVCRSEDIDGPYVGLPLLSPCKFHHRRVSLMRWLRPQIDANGTPCTENGGTEVLGSHGVVYGPGGQGVYKDPKLGAVLYYHYVNTTIGYADADKVLGVNVIHWDHGWPTV